MIKFTNRPTHIVVSFFDLKIGEFFRRENYLCIKVSDACYLRVELKDTSTGFPRFLGPYNCDIIVSLERVNINIEFV